MKTTPLIEALRERKLNKEKPQKKGRGEHKDDTTEKKILAKPGKEAASDGKGRRATKAETSKEKAQKKAVEALNKEANALKENAATEKAAAGPSSATPERKRGNVNGVKSMLQRDLGLAPASNRRRGTKREVGSTAQESTPKQEENVSSKGKGKEPVGTPAAAATAEKVTPASSKGTKLSRAERRIRKAETAGEGSKAPVKQSTTPAPTILKKPQTQVQSPAPPKGPAAARAPPNGPAAARTPNAAAQGTPVKSDASPVPRPADPTPSHATASSAPAPTGKQAFLKHANASQGITEPLIEEALKQFGTIEKVEIDKRKGFAYVDFSEPEGLRKAVAAGTVKVAQGAVQILERKEKHQVARGGFPASRPQPANRPPQGRGGFGPRGRGGRGGRSGHAVPGPSPAPVTSAPTADVAT